MNVRRGDVILVDFPYPNGSASKLRPALVIQNNRDNARLLNTIAVQITGTTHRALEATQVFIEISTIEGRPSGLAFDSVVNCVNVVTLEKTRILRKLGSLAPVLTQKVDEALKAALEL